MKQEVYYVALKISNMPGYQAAILWSAIDIQINCEINKIVEEHGICFITEVEAQADFEVFYVKVTFEPDLEKHRELIDQTKQDIELFLIGMFVNLELNFPPITLFKYDKENLWRSMICGLVPKS